MNDNFSLGIITFKCAPTSCDSHCHVGNFMTNNLIINKKKNNKEWIIVLGWVFYFYLNWLFWHFNLFIVLGSQSVFDQTQFFVLRKWQLPPKPISLICKLQPQLCIFHDWNCTWCTGNIDFYWFFFDFFGSNISICRCLPWILHFLCQSDFSPEL